MNLRRMWCVVLRETKQRGVSHCTEFAPNPDAEIGVARANRDAPISAGNSPIEFMPGLTEDSMCALRLPFEIDDGDRDKRYR